VITPGTFTSLGKVGSETSSVIADVLVPGVERVGVISTSAELGRYCVGSTSSEAVGSGSTVIEIDVVSPGIWVKDSASDWMDVICASSRIVLVRTSSDVGTVGAISLKVASTEVGAEAVSALREIVGIVDMSSLEAASTEVRAEKTSVLIEVVMTVLPASETLIDRSKDREAIFDTSRVEVGSGSSSPLVMVGSMISADVDVSSPTTADKLSTTSEKVLAVGVWIVTLSRIVVSLSRIVELGAISTAEIEGVSTTGVADGKSSEMEPT
jgi:hypothetical protein